MAITKIILQQMVTMDQNSITASKYPKYTIVLGNTISSITAAELTSAIESSKASAAAAKTSETNAKQSELNAKGSENEAKISATSSQQSATQSASSATASANSAGAAKTSETNAKASETAAKTSETNAKASETAAKTSETHAKASETAAAASASAAKTSETNAAASASAAKTSETNANNSKTAAANSANAAKTSETNAKTSETNAAASATRAESVASGMRDSIGLGNSARDCPDISGNPSAYIGFMRIREGVPGWPSIANGEAYLTGVISVNDGSPSYTGIFHGWNTRSLYTYRWSSSLGPQWTRHARKDEVDRLVQGSGESAIWGAGRKQKLVLWDGGTGATMDWGVYDEAGAKWIPLGVGRGGTGATTAAGARTNLQLNRFQRSSDTRTIVCSTDVQADGCYLQVDAGGQWGAFNPKTGRWQPLAIAQGGTGGVTAEDARTNLGLGHSSSPTFGHLQLLTENDSTQASSGILSQFLRDTSGAQRARSRIYSEIRGDNKAWLTLHLQSDANTNKYAGLSIDGNFQINGNFIGNAISLSDVVTSKVNLQVNRFVQATGETDVVNHAGTAQIFITDNKNWGAYDTELRRHIALPITQGGTGGLSISEAKTNLQIPSVGAGDWMEIAAPAGVEAGKYYPIVINAQHAGLYLSGFFIDIQTRSSGGGDPMNCCTFNGFIRTGGWSDRKDAGYGYYNRYDSSERALKCILVSAKDSEDNIAVYVEGRAFPVKMRIPKFCTATAVASAHTHGQVTFAWGTPNPGPDSVGVRTLFDFSLNRVGFYQATTEGNYYIGNGERIVLSNGMNVGDELSLTAPKITFSGTVAAGNGFTADGTSVSNATFYSRYRVGNTVYGAEFLASENAAQVIVRDPADTSHQFFNFNLNGTFSPPNGLLTSTGTDWNGQKNTINKFYGIAGSDNAPENAIYGGIHVGFSGNYATQFAGRNSKFWVRSIEAGENKEWLKLITATLAPKIPTDARDGFISDASADTSWAPSNGGGFQSCYAENRIMQSWVDNVGRLYSRFLTTNQPTAPKTDVPWKSAAMLELDNRFTGNNTFLGNLESTRDITCARLFSKGALQTESGGIELYHSTPFIDFHFNKATSDYTARIINDAANQLTFDCQSVRTLHDFTAYGLVRGCNRDAFVAWPISDPSASNGQIRLAPKFQSRFNSVGSNASGAARMSMWFEEHVGSNHRGVVEVSGYGSSTQYWHFRNDGAIWSSVKGDVAWAGTSDLRYKDNVVDYDGLQSLENIKAMNLIKFTYKDDDRKRERRGVAAQQIMEIDPCYVKKSEGSYIDANGEQVNIEKLVLDTNPLLMDALCAIKVLSAQVGELKEENTALRAGTASREEQVTALESEVSDLKKQIADLTLVVNSLLANKAQ
ncbi:lateral tail fiber protein [Escherichia phage HildyBeyeler]|uniref:Lateral tail fiber protein n=1 Tax=Escherichia phage HildyBeyeler TaxID=2852005 RepID=A0AAE7VSK7_9CAUD|nr:lateral tail fiber protein [Escherichia phage HildyBeyeler]